MNLITDRKLENTLPEDIALLIKKTLLSFSYSIPLVANANITFGNTKSCWNLPDSTTKNLMLVYLIEFWEVDRSEDFSSPFHHHIFIGFKMNVIFWISESKFAEKIWNQISGKITLKKLLELLVTKLLQNLKHILIHLILNKKKIRWGNAVMKANSQLWAEIFN